MCADEAMRRLLSSFLLASVGGACAASDAEEAGQRDALTDFRPGVVDMTLPEVDAVGYDIELVGNDVPDHETFRATVSGKYVATEDLSKLVLDFAANEIDSVRIDGDDAQHRRDGDQLTVTLPHRVQKGHAFTTEIAYHGDVLRADG